MNLNKIFVIVILPFIVFLQCDPAGSVAPEINNEACMLTPVYTSGSTDQNAAIMGELPDPCINYGADSSCPLFSNFELLNTLSRNVVINRDNPGNISYLPTKTVLNKIDVHYTIGFIGDIMSLAGRTLTLSQDLIDFFAGCDFIIGNFEGTIIDNKPVVSVKQYQFKTIIEDLKLLGPPDKIYLSVANNHAGDFSTQEFISSITQLQSAGYHVFGFRDSPYIDLNGCIRIFTGSMWANNEDGIERAVMLNELKTSDIKAGAMNILFPHYAFEMELYPRTEMISLAESYLDIFDAMIGHHTHSPQPVSAIQKSDDRLQLIAYSLGNFCFGKTTPIVDTSKYHKYGIILKIDVGLTKDKKWATGKVNWQFIEGNTDEVTTSISTVDSLPL